MKRGLLTKLVGAVLNLVPFNTNNNYSVILQAYGIDRHILWQHSCLRFVTAGTEWPSVKTSALQARQTHLIPITSQTPAVYEGTV